MTDICPFGPHQCDDWIMDRKRLHQEIDSRDKIIAELRAEIAAMKPAVNAALSGALTRVIEWRMVDEEATQ